MGPTQDFLTGMAPLPKRPGLLVIGGGLLTTAIALGLVCLALGLFQAYQGSGLLLWPLCGFVAVCGISVAQLAVRRKASGATAESVQ